MQWMKVAVTTFQGSVSLSSESDVADLKARKHRSTCNTFTFSWKMRNSLTELADRMNQ